ncbi:MAG: putative S-layer protein [archaeon]
MVSKNVFVSLGILAVLIMSLGIVSAAALEFIDISGLPPQVNTGTEYEVTFKLNHTNTTFNDDYKLNWSSNEDYVTLLPTIDRINVSNLLSGSAKITIPSDATGSVNYTLKVIAYNLSDSYKYNYTTTFTSTINDTDVVIPPTTEYKYCDDFNGEKGYLEITSFEITNNGKGDDKEWEYLDEIEIEVTIENTGEDNINDVLVDIMIKDDDDNTITRKKMNLNDDQIDLGRINDGDEEIAIFKIKELPIDLSEGNYRMYVRAYDENNEDSECASVSEDFTNSDETYFEFEVTSSKDSTVIVKDDLDNILASCGDKNVEVRFMVYNLGDDDEEKVLVTLENSKLGIYEKAVIDNLRDKKGKEVVFFITVPEELDKLSYELDIYTYYDYDEDEDELDEVVAYGESSEDGGDDFSIMLEVLSCKGPVPSITAALDSESKVGEELVIIASITNNGDDNNFVVSLTGFENWAELISIEPQSLLINEDDTATVVIKLTPTKGGFQTLKVNTVVDGETYNQAVSVNIEEKESIFANVNNVVLYSVSGIIVLLILIFLVLIVRISRKSRKAEF